MLEDPVVFASKQREPTAVLGPPLVLSFKASLPIAVLLLLVLVLSAAYPTAVLLPPVTLESSENEPTAVLPKPVVFCNKAFSPIATL